MSKYYTVKKANTPGAAKISKYNSGGGYKGGVIVRAGDVAGYCSCLEDFGYKKKGNRK